MGEDPIIHPIKRQISNMEMENRDSLISLYLNKYKEHHPKATYSTFNKRIKEANSNVNWSNLKFGQEINIPMDILKEEVKQEETTQEEAEQNTNTESSTPATSTAKTSEEKQEEESEETTEKSSGKPSKAGIYPVCNGAECMCDQSKEKIPGLLKVISHDTVYINDKDSASKILATTNDLPLPFEKQTSTFGSCLKQPVGTTHKPCIPNITKWDKSYESIKIVQAGNGTALLEESEGTCSFGGKVTFVTHGQTQAVSQADVAETPPEIVAMLTDGLVTEKEAEQLAKGTFEDNKTKKIIDINVAGPLSPTDDTYKIHVDCKEIIFKVSDPSPKKLTDKEKAAVNWAVYIRKKNGTYSHHHSFIDHGERFTFPYRTPDTYAIEAYSDSKQFDTLTGKCKGSASNLLEIIYQDIDGLSLYGNGEDRTRIKCIRPTETITVSAKKLFKEAYHVKGKNVYWEVSSGKKAIDFKKTETQVTFGDNKKDNVPQITILPQNNNETKEIKVTATFGKKTETITFKVKKNTISSISADKNTIDILREGKTKKPRHQVTFTASYVLPYTPALGDTPPNWCWYNKDDKPHSKNLITEGVNGLTYTGTSEKPGEWKVEAFVSNADGTNATIKAIVPKITKAYWADKNGNSINKSGYGHQVYIHIETEGLHGEKLQLKVWESQKGNHKYIENAGTDIEITKGNGVVNQAFTIPDDKKAGFKENYKYEFFFTIEKLDYEVQGTEQDQRVDNQYILIPKGKPHYLDVDSEKMITSLKIYETGNKLHTGIVKYGDTVTIKVATRNLVDEELEFEVWKDVKEDNHTDDYSTYDTWDDQDMKEVFKIKIDNEGNGEYTFAIPKTWEDKHKVLPQQPYYFYLKEKESGAEFPRAYYVANPNKTEEENKKNSKRIRVLMLKVAKTLELDRGLENENAVILGKELNKDVTIKNACDSLVWGKMLTCSERKKVIEIAERLNLDCNKHIGARWLMAIMALETKGTFNPALESDQGHVGLIQFSEATANKLGTTTAELKKMQFLDQLDYVEKQIARKKSKIKTITDLYLSVFYPKLVGEVEGTKLELREIAPDKCHYGTAYNEEERAWEKKLDEKSSLFSIFDFQKITVGNLRIEVMEWLTKGFSEKNRCKTDLSTCEFVRVISKDRGKESGVCVGEARVRAFLRMLRVGEGTEGEIGYTKIFGGDNFTESPHNKDMSDHPQIKIYWYTNKKGEKIYSSATGAYQVMGYVWNDNEMIKKRRKYNINDFSPLNQDYFAVIILKYKRPGLIDLIIKGQIKKAIEDIASHEWASLPPGRYGQPNKTIKEALDLFHKYLKEEQNENSDLHIQSGFLKKFGINCCDENISEKDSIITITRKWENWTGVNSKSTTISSFSISNSTIEGYIAEPYGEETEKSGKDKRIPVGTYSLVWHTSIKFALDKYASKGQPILKNGFPKLYNETVSTSRGILIHIGNTGRDSEGCLLPGNGLKKENGKVIGNTGSTSKFYELIDYIEEKGIENVKLVIKDEIN